MVSRRDPAVQNVELHFKRRPGLEPGPITTNVCDVKGWGCGSRDKWHQWIWVPAFAGTTSGKSPPKGLGQ